MQTSKTQQNMKGDLSLLKPTEGYYAMLGGTKYFPSETERRVKDFCKELDVKRSYDKFTTFETKADEMIIGNHLRLFSICEHHLLPFYGKVSIGYIPRGKIFGLSKLQRIVDKFASRPQIQEELTIDIADFIYERIQPKGVGIVIKAIHTCVFARGTQSSDAEFMTNVMRGDF